MRTSPWSDSDAFEYGYLKHERLRALAVLLGLAMILAGQPAWSQNMPYMVKDIWIGSGSSSPANLTNVNGTLFFTAHDEGSGMELWKSDGTPGGTVMVKDIWPGVNTSLPSYLTNVNGTVFFAAEDSSTGYELWKSDGTAAGTVLVKDIVTGSVSGSISSYPRELTNFNGTLFFAAWDEINNFQLWKSDGTEEGTVVVKDTYPGGDAGLWPRYLIDVNGTLFFLSDAPLSIGDRLWKSDGTPGGTVMVVPDDRLNFAAPYMTNVDGTLFFRAGSKLWKSDGTAEGTVVVKDVAAINLITADNTLFFFTTLPGGLWKSNGTDAGTASIKDFAYVGTGPSYMSIGNTLFFVADDGTNGFELWKSDGTANGTVMVKDIWTGSDSAHPNYLANAHGTLFFAASDGPYLSNFNLWRSDGTTAGTVRLGTVAHYPTELTVAGERLLFSATNGTACGTELWAVDLSDLVAGVHESTWQAYR